MRFPGPRVVDDARRDQRDCLCDRTMAGDTAAYGNCRPPVRKYPQTTASVLQSSLASKQMRLVLSGCPLKPKCEVYWKSYHTAWVVHLLVCTCSCLRDEYPTICGENIAMALEHQMPCDDRRFVKVSTSSVMSCCFYPKCVSQTLACTYSY
ncbi:hypothetical protein OBBRIDRAFT_90777 [Obba rivulosa]|uniref:Uncharacterized protein n=1 Tax=Obba rivulosa TaxID=1052685 RepID=A0A8E2DMS6_9APHY|nr:hypothetical protein OBBRIDRAFT_90777 [Obba rivulosa]